MEEARAIRYLAGIALRDSRAAFREGMRAFTGGTAAFGQLLPRGQCTLQAVDAALGELALAAPPLKRQVVAGCVACVKADQQITVREPELLRAVCATLGCPMPPLVRDD